MIHKLTENAIANTQLLGTIKYTYQNLVKNFGEPFKLAPGEKGDVMWVLELDGVVVRIENRMDGPNFLGGQGKNVQCIKNWFVGGVAGTDAVMATVNNLHPRVKEFETT